MLIKVRFELEGNERKVLEGLGFLSKAPEEGLFKKPLTAEEASEELGKITKAVEDKAEASEDKPKKAKATKSTPKEEKAVPEAPVSSDEAIEELRGLFYDLIQGGKRKEAKAFLSEYGVAKLTELIEGHPELVPEALAKIKEVG